MDNKTKNFVTRANEKHGYRYSYDNVDYVRASVHVSISCKDHGEFKQLPRNHLRGQGCPHCAEDARLEKGSEVGSVRARQKNESRFFPPGTILKLPFWD